MQNQIDIDTLIKKLDPILVKGIEEDQTIFQAINSIRGILDETEKECLEGKKTRLDEIIT
jgi:hypothetical protein